MVIIEIPKLGRATDERYPRPPTQTRGRAGTTPIRKPVLRVSPPKPESRNPKISKMIPMTQTPNKGDFCHVSVIIHHPSTLWDIGSFGFDSDFGDSGFGFPTGLSLGGLFGLDFP